MKKILIFILILSARNIFCQDVLISVKEQNELVANVSNYIEILASCVPHDSLFLTTTNGEISKELNGYKVIPDKPGNTIFNVFRLYNNDTILLLQKDFSVVSLNKYCHATIGNRNSGAITKEYLKLLYGINAHVDGLGFDFSLPVQSYNLIALKNDTLFLNKIVHSNKFDDELKRDFDLLAVGDRLYFVDIIGLLGEKQVRLNYISFVIED
ncbi:hypothetical protein ACE1ET_20245 [Saccharicrinis sp. FJH62]|uniref:hypothetical protein n=1 Tax=Saccharicrinis sp. FJH62 TaxID=3344657 RepID=UPI0035D4A1F1